MNEAIIGWDIGGAHLKAACIERDGRVTGVWLVACPLWRGLDQLNLAIDQIEANIQQARGRQFRHAITMTGEMVDLFEARQAGVLALAALLAQRFGSDRVHFMRASSVGSMLNKHASRHNILRLQTGMPRLT